MMSQLAGWPIPPPRRSVASTLGFSIALWCGGKKEDVRELSRMLLEV